MKTINTLVIAVGGKCERIAADLKKKGINTSKVFLNVSGKPIVSHLIDMALRENFQRIYLLISHYDQEFRTYLNQVYPKNKKIIPIYGGLLGKRWGVPWFLEQIKNDLNRPFIYSDGNILYKQSILKVIKKYCFNHSLVNLVLSESDYATTHSSVISSRGRIYCINTRLRPYSKSHVKCMLGKCYCSMGLMVINPMIFRTMRNFSSRKDLDNVVNDIFTTNKGLIKPVIYKGKWLSIHTIKDIDKLKNKW